MRAFALVFPQVNASPSLTCTTEADRKLKQQARLSRRVSHRRVALATRFFAPLAPRITRYDLTRIVRRRRGGAPDRR